MIIIIIIVKKHIKQVTIFNKCFIFNNNNNNNNNNNLYDFNLKASYTKYGPFTSFGPIYDLSESSLSTFEISTIEPYLYNINEQRNDKNNVNKELNKSNENSIVNDVKDEYIEINNNEIKDWEKMGIDVESICQNLNINYKKNNENSYENVKSYDERISEISQLLKQLYEIQEERKKRNYYQTEISVDEKELGLFLIYILFFHFIINFYYNYYY